jgi:hypothetical protein
LGIPATKGDLPSLEFEPIEEEQHGEKMKRATLGYQQGIMTRDESRDILHLSPAKDGGDEFKEEKSLAPTKPPFEQDKDNETSQPNTKKQEDRETDEGNKR